MSYSLLKVFSDLRIKKLSRSELNFLITFSYKISYSLLKAKYGQNIANITHESLSLEDIAMDAIIPLFVNNGNRKLGILNSLENWDSPLNNDADAEFFLSQIIWRRVEQTVTKFFKQKDPVFSKILKTLNACIKTNDFRKQRYFGTVYITNSKNLEINGRVIDDNEFNKLPQNLFKLRQAELFNSIFEYLLSETDYYPAIPLNSLVRRIKLYYLNHYSGIAVSETNDNFLFTYSDIVKEEIMLLKEKLHATYVVSGKLTEENAEKLYKSFQNISNDLLNGGVHSSLYDYLSDFDKNLTKEEFYSKYHHIMHYLLKQLKNNIAEKIIF